MEIIVSSFEDYDKLVNGGNVAAGGRVRKAAMEAINALKAVRKDIQTTRNTIASSRAGTTTTTTTTNTWPPSR